MFQSIRLFGFAVLLVGVGSIATHVEAAEALTLDQDKSKISFVGSKADGKHEGGFKQFSADAVADFETPENGSLEITIQTSSLWSDDEKLTNHLKNPDFFDVRKYPAITFKATKVSKGEEKGKATITGILTMLGKPVEVEVPVTATMDDTTVTMTADFKIDRMKWGMEYGKGKINDDVVIQSILVFKR